MHVARKGDDNNALSRAKYVIDLLQTYKQTVTGKRVQGLLDLIENDDVLNHANRTVEEQSVKAIDTGKLDKLGRKVKQAPYKVMVWVGKATQQRPKATQNGEYHCLNSAKGLGKPAENAESRPIEIRRVGGVFAAPRGNKIGKRRVSRERQNDEAAIGVGARGRNG